MLSTRDLPADAHELTQRFVDRIYCHVEYLGNAL
jgi:hypothetical protein